MSDFIASYLQRFSFVFLIMGLLFVAACGEDESPAPTVLSITANLNSADEGEQFAITVRTDTPNRTGTDITVALIYEGIDQSLIEGADIAPIIQQNQEFSSQTLVVNDNPDSSGSRVLTVRIDESQVPAGLTLGNSSVTITIQDN